MINFPTCKINLGLHVLRKRTDGYHDIASCMLEIPWNDVLEITPAKQDAFTSSGLEIPGEGNFVLDALRVFREVAPIPAVQIQLHKVIPMGGGLGGGSADAAFALKMLRDQFHPSMENQTLKVMAARIGSDCPFFIEGGMQFASGRGEILSPMANVLNGKWVLLVNTGIHVSTKTAYAQMLPNADRDDLKSLLAKNISEWSTCIANDFENTVFALHPTLKDVKSTLYSEGAIYASMTGSGSTMYGIFDAPKSMESLSNAAYMQWVQIV